MLHTQTIAGIERRTIRLRDKNTSEVKSNIRDARLLSSLL